MSALFICQGVKLRPQSSRSCVVFFLSFRFNKNIPCCGLVVVVLCMFQQMGGVALVCMLASGPGLLDHFSLLVIQALDDSDTL